MESGRVKKIQLGRIAVEIHQDSRAAGVAAAQSAAETLRKLAETRRSIGVIFATGASQMRTLEALASIDDVPWNKVHGFHMDEYIGIASDHPASFRRYLRERLTQKVPISAFYEIDGNAPDLGKAAKDYSELVAKADPQLCLLGIGENGHLAFNDPGVADFADQCDAKIVYLDTACRGQQVAEGWFAGIDEVPDAAITLTIPALLRVSKLIVSVPGPRKAAVVRRALSEAVSTDCPATILRTHPDTTIYLDRESAAELDHVLVS